MTTTLSNVSYNLRQYNAPYDMLSLVGKQYFNGTVYQFVSPTSTNCNTLQSLKNLTMSTFEVVAFPGGQYYQPEGIYNPREIVYTVGSYVAAGPSMTVVGNGYCWIYGSGSGTDWLYGFWRIREMTGSTIVYSGPQTQAGRGSGQVPMTIASGSTSVVISTTPGTRYQLELRLYDQTNDGADITWYTSQYTMWPYTLQLVSTPVLPCSGSITYLSTNSSYAGTNDYSGFVNNGVTAYPDYGFVSNNANGGDWQWMTYMASYNLDGTYNGSRTYGTQTEVLPPVSGYPGHWLSSQFSTPGYINGITIKNSIAFVSATGVCGPKDFRVYGKYSSGSYFLMGEFTASTWGTTETTQTFNFRYKHIIDTLLVIVNTIYPTADILLSRVSIGMITPI